MGARPSGPLKRVAQSREIDWLTIVKSRTATHLTQNVLPMVPYRQFVVSFPIPLRHWLHMNKRFAAEVFGIVSREIHRYYLSKALAAGITDATPGSITFTQR